MISQVSIRNFRSLGNSDLSAQRITTLVGANDAGKSNVLRALNLFFNRETDLGEAFNFKKDFNQFAITPPKKAPQIDIKIIFDLPSGYHRPGLPTKVEWLKVWRREGEVKSMESLKFIDGNPIPDRSKIPALMDRIRYTYVPAIKDKAFFADLQGRLYDVLSSVAEEPLQQSAGAFQAQLGEQLHDLLDALEAGFGAQTIMRLPENLREIFENLEINSEGIPLSRRGDGIKVRHIPKILEFIAKKRDELLTSGSVRSTHIWGFEEPENNVEMSAAFKMAGEFLDTITGTKHFQLFFTTHSPIFYRLDQHRTEAADSIVSHFVSKDGHNTQFKTCAPDEADQSMGLMPIVAPYLAEAKARYDELNRQLISVREIAGQRRPTVFVEGKSDTQILTYAWDLFSGLPTSVINITAGDGAFGGANAVQSRAIAWLLTLRHRPVGERVKAAAIFDTDESGKQARVSLTEEMNRLKLETLGLKVIALRMPTRLRELAKIGFNISVDLESFYTDEMWQWAEDNGKLEPISKSNIASLLSSKMLEDLVAGNINPFTALDERDALRLKFKFSDAGKIDAARKLTHLPRNKAEHELEEFRALIDELLKHFTIGHP